MMTTIEQHLHKPLLLCLVLLLGIAFPQAVEGQGGPMDTVRELMAVPYPDDTISVAFMGTERLPKASGEAKVERRNGVTEIEIELDEMKPAQSFGGDYNTYVFWAASPEGQIDNLGEFRLEGNRSKLNVSTRLDTFALFVTAEPHFLVEKPSRFIVLENTELIDPVPRDPEVARIEFPAYDRLYAYERDTLADSDEANGPVRTDMDQARTALRLARDAQAEMLVPAEFADAQAALNRALGAAEVEEVQPGEISSLANRAVRAAVRAQRIAEERAFQEALANERQEQAAEIDRLETEISHAAGEADAARLRAERAELQLQIEQNARQAASRSAAEARQEARMAEAEAAAARAERDTAFERMRQALDEIAETRETARGFVVSIPDVLFDFDAAALRPEGRERLSKIAGVLVATDPSFTLEIEGHTDNVGTSAYNQRLSRERAEAVEDYLLDNGVGEDVIDEVRGVGESEPRASNETTEGRQRNRRVEIIIDTVASQIAARN